MLRAVFAWLSARLGTGAESSDGEAAALDGDADSDEAATDSDDDTGFTRSRLDASVLFAHGKRGDAERSIAGVQDQARALEEQRRD
jgi:hypothetical protein